MCDTDLSDEGLVEKFRREFNQQFHVLVRMHLSFVLDQATDENECLSEKKLKKWSSSVPFNKKSTRPRGEGVPLTQEGICQVYQLIEFLRNEQNIKIEGVFRRTGSLTRQQELRNLLSRGITLDLEGGQFSVHDCASVLKGFLADLPEPLLTEAHYPAYCQIAALCNVGDGDKLLVALQLLLLLLPSENKVLLRDILDLLNFTASHETSNRMSADNLATLFTPHLLCPRNLSPERLHSNVQTLSSIVSFMITNNVDIFKIPRILIVEFRARFDGRRAAAVASSSRRLDESVGDQFAANTVFTFVDQERTAKENESNTTETALAQLYAHIQSLPESSKKRRLVKQFNKENGQGTPLQVLRSGGVHKNKSFGDSLKKHIFQKSVKKVLKVREDNSDTTTTPVRAVSTRTRLFCTNGDSSTERERSPNDADPRPKKARLSKDDDDVQSCATSTPARVTIDLTPDGRDRKSMSPITRSTRRMTRAMQETMMTPRSRKPVLLVSGTNINALAKVESEVMDGVPEEKDEDNDDSSLADTFKGYLESRNMLATSSPSDSSFSSQTDDFNSDEFDVTPSKMTNSLYNCLDGGEMDDESEGEKELILKPKQFDENGRPTVFETSF